MFKKSSTGVCLLLCILFTSCTGMTPSDKTVETGGSGVDGAPGISIEAQFPVYADDIAMMQFLIRNSSGADVEFGAEWSIEKKEGDTWYTLPFQENTGWNSLAYLLGDGGSSVFTVRTDMLGTALEDGDYRVLKEIDGAYYAAEFTVGASPVGKDSPYGYVPLEQLPDDYTAEQAAADGVKMADDDLTEFFSDIADGMNAQLRLGTVLADGTLSLTDITAEQVLGCLRICYQINDGAAPLYYSHIVTDGQQVALSDFMQWNDADDAQLVVDALTGNQTAVQTAVGMLLQNSTFASDGVFWSPDGSKVITIGSDSEAPLAFGISVLYEDGGSAGQMTGLSDSDAPGMIGIRSAVWSDNDTVMFLCDTEMAGMTGYVVYDTAAYRVKSYTTSAYDYVVSDEGILIPE